MVRIIERVQQVTVERVDILKAREGFDCCREALGKGLSGVFDFSRVKSSDSADFEARTNL
jgi:hypothetical protein